MKKNINNKKIKLNIKYKKTIKVLSIKRLELYQLNSEIIKFWRRNPVIACEDLLGIKLLDYQKYMLQMSWSTPSVLWACARNAGKTFLGAIFIILKCLLYENQAIYIVSSVGSQAQETFMKIEEIVLRTGKTSSSMVGSKDIAAAETVKSGNNKDGFSHAPSGYHVKFYNGSEIFTVNGKPDNNRSRRATMVFFDEAGFSSNEQITVAEAFATQNSNFKTSINSNFNINTLRKNCPTQLVYASSASDTDTTFFRHYKNFAKRMFIGDDNYFCCDIPCDVPLNPYMDGEPHEPLFEKSIVDKAMKVNKDKCLKEYFNKFAKDGGEEQIIKWAMIRRNETFALPVLHYEQGAKYVFAFDPARINDNSILTIMELVNDEEIGYYGKIVNCVSLLDISSRQKFKLTSVSQLQIIREYMLTYNGNAPDYENIYKLLIDPGAGGGGVNAYGDNLLLDWQDKKGITHRGMIDTKYEVYDGFQNKYPNAVDILSFLPPKKLRTKMVEEFLELLKLDLIKFPREYSGLSTVNISHIDESKKDKELVITTKTLTLEEHMALVNIDLLKTECTSIHKIKNAEGTSVSYVLPKEKENKTHDDRFYTMIMLSHFLYELRRGAITEKKVKPVNFSKIKYRSPKKYN